MASRQPPCAAPAGLCRWEAFRWPRYIRRPRPLCRWRRPDQKATVVTMSTSRRPSGPPSGRHRLRRPRIDRPRRRRPRNYPSASNRCRLAKRRRRRLHAKRWDVLLFAPLAASASAILVEDRNRCRSVGCATKIVCCPRTPSSIIRRVYAAWKDCTIIVRKRTMTIAAARTIRAVAVRIVESRAGAVWPLWSAHCLVWSFIGRCAVANGWSRCATSGTRAEGVDVGRPNSRPGRPPNDCWQMIRCKTFNLLIRILVYIELPPHLLRSPVF